MCRNVQTVAFPSEQRGCQKIVNGLQPFQWGRGVGKRIKHAPRQKWGPATVHALWCYGALEEISRHLEGHDENEERMSNVTPY